ncbi:MAG: endopeptidase La [Lachnospiraceae bacterium]|nr:endopeptidase La [Lachnospiraceae bacterium]
MNEDKILIPVIALRGMTILPAMVVHFDVSRTKSIHALEKAMVHDQKILVITQKDPEDEEPTLENLYQIGTICEIKQLIKLPNNIIRVLVEGKERAELENFIDDEEALIGEVYILENAGKEELDSVTMEAMMRIVKELLLRYSTMNPKLNRDTVKLLTETGDLEYLLDQIANNIPLRYEQKQELLEAFDLTLRYEVITRILGNEIEVLRIRKEFQEEVKARVDKNQKEYILREQMKLIRDELGEGDSTSDADHYLEALGKLKASKEVKDKIKKEIIRFKSIGTNSSESSVARTYIETLLEMPWNKASKDSKDLKKANDILEADHYGLKKVKERILEFLAVRLLTEKGESPIICLVGPPGTGKTSVARSVAKALNKEYVRISLGGVRDEAEIRGHRRTYVGAMPGRIATGLRNAGVKNPLMLLDEIDKVSSDYKGDTSSALLEVLDSEQNSKFRDHYIEIPIDLSEVLFIATANSVQDIPKPLLDRMEMIEVTSYTENEKAHIAKDHLIPKQLKKHGIKEKQLLFSDKAVESMIHSYTREAGVRGLERKIGEICRKAAREILEDKKAAVKVTESNLKKYLGKELYIFDVANETDEIGIVRGLAWTSVGGDTLQIEVNIMPGKGELKLTGKLGDVMKESAQAGVSYIRSIASNYQLAENYFEKHDIHIHIPEGAVPKDGPSAGITMATAMLSAMIEKPVRADLAMTGEITLRGRVLPIGGLKEKILAAKMAHIKTVLVPEKNRRDVAEISSEILKGIQIEYVENMEQVITHAIIKK